MSLRPIAVLLALSVSTASVSTASVSTALAAETPSSGAPFLEGWRQFPFGISPETALERLGGTGERYGASIRSAVDIEGANYMVLMSFRAGRLHDVFLKSSLDRGRVGTDRLCAAFHQRLAGQLAATYGRGGDSERSTVGQGARGAIFDRTRLPFANGGRIVAETKFIPSLGGNGLCVSSLSYQDGD